MAMKRGAAANSETLTLYAELLSKLPTNVVDDVIERLSNEQPGRFESALPNWPTLRSMMNDHNHPLLQLRTIVRKLAKQFGEAVDEAMLLRYQQGVGITTDEDLTKAYDTILRSDIRRMPTPGELRIPAGSPIGFAMSRGT